MKLAQVVVVATALVLLASCASANAGADPPTATPTATVSASEPPLPSTDPSPEPSKFKVPAGKNPRTLPKEEGGGANAGPDATASSWRWATNQAPARTITGPGWQTTDIYIAGHKNEFARVFLYVRVTYSDYNFMQIDYVGWNYYGWGNSTVCGGPLHIYNPSVRSVGQVNPSYNRSEDHGQCWKSQNNQAQWNYVASGTLALGKNAWYRGGCKSSTSNMDYPAVEIRKFVSPNGANSAATRAAQLTLTYFGC
jgi:hypothetical protein